LSLSKQSKESVETNKKKEGIESEKYEVEKLLKHAAARNSNKYVFSEGSSARFLQ